MRSGTVTTCASSPPRTTCSWRGTSSPPAEPAASASTTTCSSSDLRGFTDEDGRRYDAGPALEWSDGFDALLEVRASAASRARVVWAGASRVAIGLAVAAAVAAGLFQLIWWAGHDQPAGVVRHVSDGEEVLYCGVRWTDGSGEGRYAEVDCYEPYPPVGRTISVRALAWPFEGSAMDDEGSFEVLTTLTLAPAALALATGLGLGLRRAWRAPVRLRAVAPGSPARADLALEEAQGLPLRALARRVAEREGWAGETDPAPTPPGPWAQVRMAAGTARWWPALPLAAIAGLSEGVPTPWRAALAAGGAVLLLWALGRTAGCSGRSALPPTSRSPASGTTSSSGRSRTSGWCCSCWVTPRTGRWSCRAPTRSPRGVAGCARAARWPCRPPRHRGRDVGAGRPGRETRGRRPRGPPRGPRRPARRPARGARRQRAHTVTT